MKPDMRGFKENPGVGREPGVESVLQRGLLRVYGDAVSAGEMLEIDAVSLALKAKIDSKVNEPFALEAFPHSGFGQKVNRSLLKQARAHAFFAILPGARLDDDGFNSLQMQKVRKNQSGGTRADDSNLHEMMEMSPRATAAQFKVDLGHFSRRKIISLGWQEQRAYGWQRGLLAA